MHTIAACTPHFSQPILHDFVDLYRTVSVCPTSGHPFYRAFFFSVDTFATIRYGNIIPVGVAANTLVTIEALLNILGIAMRTQSSLCF